MRRLSCWLVGALSLCLASCQNSELQKTDTRVGEGPEAKDGDVVVVHYTGRLRNGMKFESSKDRDDPYTFTLGAGKVIKGWDKGVAGMKVGGIRKLVIPPELAYGASRKGDIPPNSELTFEIEMLEINPKPPQVKITDIKVGTGEEARGNDIVEMHYTGWFKDGKKFDSSKDRDELFRFQLGAGEVIKGWDQGIVGMKVGGIRKLVIPPELAYGARGRNGIPPNSELTFEVQMVNLRRP